VQNKEGALCTTQWREGYNPAVHRKYPQKFASVSISAAESTEDSLSNDASPRALPDAQPTLSLRAVPRAVPESFGVGQGQHLDITIRNLLNEKDVEPAPSLLDHSYKYVGSYGKPGNGATTATRAASFISPAAKTIEVQHLQSLLPAKEAVFKIIDYYYENMLYWVSGLYHGPTFRRDLTHAYANSSYLDLQDLDWRWTALLFSIMSSGVIGSSETISISWGFSIDDKVRLARDWGNACVMCLNLGNFTSQYHIYSIQAIWILHGYEHLAGSTNQWLALSSVAVIIARGLGLHRCVSHLRVRRMFSLSSPPRFLYGFNGFFITLRSISRRRSKWRAPTLLTVTGSHNC
jgi:hypothetical protein